MRDIILNALLLGLLVALAYAGYDLYRIWRHKKTHPGVPYVHNMKAYKALNIYLIICGVTALYFRLS
ncbi:hypothetical protein KDH83_09470 [Achromobacter sp. Marseille-Q0513]|uniref:hypothetical protein n=1 Tax=Achromobacter sp. Marseille-Q0513 TaxID=2829161 RepID=UPI001B9A0D3B|nr:hypothetical protein [Achromobacter sp. Marseille-Q0513]MBR8653531.1 hypothetical protein [Achromobacter sp. Marseille-Q0513]